MISRVRLLAIRELARGKLLENDNMRLPVRPKALAEKLKIVVQSFDPPEPDISGFLMVVGSSFGIGYSTAIRSEGFQNFTVSHELGHYFIDDHPVALLANGMHYSRSGYISKDRYEEEADAFATEILMPWKLIEPLLRRDIRGFGAIKTLAEKCESSFVASAIRYTEVCRDEAVAVVVSHNGVVEFMTASDRFRQIRGIDWLHRGNPLPSTVPSLRLSRDLDWLNSDNVAEEGSRLCDWFPAAPSAEVEEDVIPLGSYRRALTVLVTDCSTADDEDEEDDAEADYIERWKEGRFRR